MARKTVSGFPAFPLQFHNVWLVCIQIIQDLDDLEPEILILQHVVLKTTWYFLEKYHFYMARL